MNICMIIDSIGWGGAERVALNLADEFLKYNHNITFIAIDDIVKITIDNRINFHSLSFKKRKLFTYSYYEKQINILLSNIEKEDGEFDFIFVNLYKASRVMKNYKKDNCYHIIHNIQSNSALKDKEGLKRLKILYRLQSVYNHKNIICVSKCIKEDTVNNIKIKSKTMQVIYNPFDIVHIRKLSTEDITNDINYLGDYIIFVGSLVKQKRADYLIEAYAKSNIKENLVLLGEGEERDRLEKQAIDLGIQDKVFFLHPVKNPFPYIKNAKLLVLFSLYEGFGNVIAESLILQVPAIANDNFGPSEILSYYTKDAIVKNTNSTEQLSNKIIEFIKKAPIVNKDCMNQFSSKEIADQYLKLNNG